MPFELTINGNRADVRVVIEVADSVTGSMREYRNSLGRAFQPINDTDAFAVCP